MGRGTTKGWARATARGAAILFSLTAAVFLATAANAQLGDVGGQTGVDTDYTPVGKESKRWSQVAGARFGRGEVKDSVTPFELDLFTVDFQASREDDFTHVPEGFAGGAECAESLDLPAEAEKAKNCERVPVIWHYTEDEERGGEWKEVYRGQGKGYVGAISWITDERALAVGGDGVYPRREMDPSTPENDPAGNGRAWLYENGTWRELTNLPAGMRGMTALDFSPRPKDCGLKATECGVAGAFRQLWEWTDEALTDGAFVRGLDETSPPEELDRAPLFRFRVRDVEFSKQASGHALAVTSGCCEPDSARNIAWLLVRNDDRWYVRSHTGEPSNALYGQSQSPPVDGAYRTLVDGIFNISLGGELDYEERKGAWDAGKWLTERDLGLDDPRPDNAEEDPIPPVPLLPEDNPLADETDPIDGAYTDQFRQADEQVSPTGPSVRQADSYYAVSLSTGFGLSFELVASPGGPRPPDSETLEEAAGQRISGSVSSQTIDRGHRNGSSTSTGSVTTSVPGVTIDDKTLLSSLRLLGIDGREAVGSFAANGQAAAFGDAEDPPDRSPQALANCGEPPKCEPDANGWIAAHGSQKVFRLTSYALNAVDVVTPDGAGWAVGDRGAILSVGARTAASTAADAPDPPQLGRPEKAPLSTREPYEEAAPPVAHGGSAPVPSLGDQPLEKLREPRLVSHGTPDTATADFGGGLNAVVMSRDGSEGWAFPSGAAPGSIYRYDGEWTRCDSAGIPGELEADPTCEVFAPLQEHAHGGSRSGPVAVRAAVRIPLERDDNPANDDDFEILAITDQYRERPGEPERALLMRYAKGRWSIDYDATDQVDASSTFRLPLQDISFATPDDGWIVANTGTGGIWHFNGTRWIDCGARDTKPELCGNEEGRLPLRGVFEPNSSRRRGFHLTTAGDRTYMYGARGVGPSGNEQSPFPMIIYRDPGGEWMADNGGRDPAFTEDPAGPDPAEGGQIWALSVAQRPGGGYEGWASGTYGGEDGALPKLARNAVRVASPPKGVRRRVEEQRGSAAAMLRLTPDHSEPSKGEWRPWKKRDATDDYRADQESLPFGGPVATRPRQAITIPGERGFTSVIAPAGSPVLGFSEDRERWQAFPAPYFPAGIEGPGKNEIGATNVLAPDGKDSFWAAVRRLGNYQLAMFYRYTDRAPRPVFDDVPHPVGSERVMAASGGADGSFWVATDSNKLHRYDRATGWETVRIPGWDPGRTVTRPSSVLDVAIGPDGSGLAVGRAGRIAKISPSSVSLDAAAGTVCKTTPALPPCGTSRNLHTVAVAPDGSALAGGDHLALLWRPAGGELRAVTPPRTARGDRIVALTMPRPDRAWLLTERQVGGSVEAGKAYVGRLVGGDWQWRTEELTPAGSPVSLDEQGVPIRLIDIEINAEGRGLLVGEHGLILERMGDSERPWRRLRAGVHANLSAVALPVGGGKGALIGGDSGLILTRKGDRFEVARHAEPFDGVTSAGFHSRIAGLALMPGTRPGESEAWAAFDGNRVGRNPIPSAVYHHASEPELRFAERGRALPDAPAPRKGEISLAAFGKQDCLDEHAHGDVDPYTRAKGDRLCYEMTGANMTNQAVAARIREELARRRAAGQLDFTLFTGDAVEPAGHDAGSTPFNLSPHGTVLDPSIVHHRWREIVADPLLDDGIPLFGAIGAQDLSHHISCTYGGGTTPLCVGTRRRDVHLPAVNIPWRESMTAMAKPWGEGRGIESGSLRFVPASSSGVGSQKHKDVSVRDPDGDGLAPGVRVPTGGASTHYAVDVKDDSADRRGAVARVVFVDTSLGSLAAADPVQQPLELDGGQAAWLEKMLCIRGESVGCTRRPDQKAIVVSNAPTYSYGPTRPDELQSDATAFETILMKNRTNLVVSGRLGWNGLYWATAPGVHEPCPGGEYQTEAPDSGARACGRGSEAPSADNAAEAPGQLADAIAESGGPDLGSAAPATAGLGGASEAQRPLPFVVAGSAGGKFGSQERDPPASEGFWRGYTVVRLSPSGDPTETIVEQRPVFDWIGITAAEHTLRPGQKMRLRGRGREVVGMDQEIRYDEISSPAITHRYDLLEADPSRPWVPREDSEGNYVPLDPSVATVENQSGQIRVGRGNQPRTYAIALLSVGEHVATYPLVFEPRRTFKPQAAPAPTQAPRVIVQSAAAATPSVPPSATPPQVAGLTPPPLPNLTPPPPPAAGPPAANPPAPPPPPPPPPPSVPTPLDLALAPPGLNIAPPASVVPPPAPPINPAPPGGARKEARQRQAATEKSGSEAGGSTEQAKDGAGDTANAPPGAHGAAMTRRDRAKAQGSFTTVSRTEQPSAWARGALYGGGLTIAALLSAGLWTARPRPRPRPPAVPAPARTWARRR